MALLLAAACGTAGGGAAHAGGDEPDGSAARVDAGVMPPWPTNPFPEPPAPPDNPTTDAKAALGRLLFYDPVVSVDHQVACGTCHSEFWGMSDGLAVSVGNGGGLLAGPGRSGPHVTRRNAPTLWNVAFRESAFWDGRAASLEDQVHFPFDSADEFARPMSDVVGDLQGIPAYADLFAAAFPGDPGPVTGLSVSRAIAAFERTILSRRGLYDAYVQGDSAAMSAPMQRGMRLFGQEGCANCHVPPLFSSERFEDRGVPPIPGVDDAGRYEVTNDEADRNRFKVPPLRNLHDSGPFFHTGTVATLDLAVRHEVGESVTRNGARALDDGEIEELTTFLKKGLIDAEYSPSRPHEVPSGFPLPIDGFAIRR
jgi:cytochrome c peroxidase